MKYIFLEDMMSTKMLPKVIEAIFLLVGLLATSTIISYIILAIMGVDASWTVVLFAVIVAFIIINIYRYW